MQPTCLRNKPTTFINEINSCNKPILMAVSAQMERYRTLSGLSYERLSKKVGCSDTALYRLSKGQLEYCSLSFLSAIALACEGSLIEWLRMPIAEDVDTFGSLVK